MKPDASVLRGQPEQTLDLLEYIQKTGSAIAVRGDRPLDSLVQQG